LPSCRGGRGAAGGSGCSRGTARIPTIARETQPRLQPPRGEGFARVRQCICLNTVSRKRSARLQCVVALAAETRTSAGTREKCAGESRQRPGATRGRQDQMLRVNPRTHAPRGAGLATVAPTRPQDQTVGRRVCFGRVVEGWRAVRGGRTLPGPGAWREDGGAGAPRRRRASAPGRPPPRAVPPSATSSVSRSTHCAGPWSAHADTARGCHG
jgi:hypothetical protein